MARKNLDRFSRVKPTINFYSKKNRSLMFCESFVEEGALYEIEFDPTISRYVTQPISYQLYRAGNKRRYTPDILVKSSNGHFWYEEVKCEEEAKDPSFIADHNFRSLTILEMTGIPLKLRVSEAPHRSVYQENLKYLYDYLGYAFDQQELLRIKEIDRPMILKDVFDRLLSPGSNRFFIFAALAQGLLGFDKHVRVDEDLIVWGAV